MRNLIQVVPNASDRAHEAEVTLTIMHGAGTCCWGPETLVYGFPIMLPLQWRCPLTIRLAAAGLEMEDLAMDVRSAT